MTSVFFELRVFAVVLDLSCGCQLVSLQLHVCGISSCTTSICALIFAGVLQGLMFSFLWNSSHLRKFCLTSSVFPYTLCWSWGMYSLLVPKRGSMSDLEKVVLH